MAVEEAEDVWATAEVGEHASSVEASVLVTDCESDWEVRVYAFWQAWEDSSCEGE